jgi:hypothetical protein
MGSSLSSVSKADQNKLDTSAHADVLRALAVRSDLHSREDRTEAIELVRSVILDRCFGDVKANFEVTAIDSVEGLLRLFTCDTHTGSGCRYVLVSPGGKQWSEGHAGMDDAEWKPYNKRLGLIYKAMGCKDAKGKSLLTYERALDILVRSDLLALEAKWVGSRGDGYKFFNIAKPRSKRTS